MLLSIQSRRFSKLKILTSVKRHSSGSVRSIGTVVVVVDTGPIVVVVVDTGPIVVVGVGPVVVVVDTGPIVVVVDIGIVVVVVTGSSIQSTTFLNPPLDF